MPKDLKIIRTKSFTVEQHNASCSVCHAKMSPVTPTFTPGDRFFDHFDLVTLEDSDFYPDGRDLGENYTYTSWRMSPCVKAGGCAIGAVQHERPLSNKRKGRRPTTLLPATKVG